MFSKPIAVAGIAAGCIVAAGVGGYLATRSLATVSEETAQATLASATERESGVIESEGIVSPIPSPSGAITTPAADSAAPPATPVQTPASSAPETPTAAAPSAAGRRPASRPAPPRTEPARPQARRAPATPEPTRHESPEPPSASPAPEPARDTVRAEAEFPAMPSAPESRPAPREPEKVFEDLVVAADSVIGLQIERTVTSESARVEDRVEARVTRDVRADGSVAIPAGSKMQGSVTLVDRGGKVRERARLGIRFHTLVLADGTQLPLRSETVYREGDSPTGESSAKIGGAAVGGAILGAILGGRKGAAVGGSIGAAGGTAAVMAGDRNAAVLQSGSTVTVRLSEPVTVTVEKPAKE